ncbi:MAG: hypothetical protein HC889_11900 [Synechococcaceae cyanobacterium SM1_2_3]|jgi:hypothetical protein|nr:hypothetical protein [Synechococcaceae cyanobacterium SM1_2_3]
MEKLHSEQTRLQGELAESSIYEDAHKNRLKGAMLRNAEVDKKLAEIESE